MKMCLITNKGMAITMAGALLMNLICSIANIAISVTGLKPVAEYGSFHQFSSW